MSQVEHAPMARRSRLPRLLAGGACVIGALVPSPWAGAAWTAPGEGGASASSTTVPGGPQPVASVSGRHVTVTWPASALASGEGAPGYSVRRYSASGSPATTGSACNVTQTGLTCTESAVAPGTWSYRVAVVAGSWSGPEGSAASAAVPSPALTLSPVAPVTAVLGTVSGTISGFVGPASLTYRLDNPTTGAVLSGSPATVPANGQASVSVTVPAGTAGGSHTLYVIGSGSAGDVAGAAFTVDVTPPTPLTLATGDGGGNAGSVEPGDWIEVIYSEPLKASSICSTWANDGAAKTLTSGVTVSVANSGVLLSNDVVTVTATGCGAGGLRFGSIDLGAGGYVRSGTVATFGATGTSSTVTWDPATAKLRIVLGSANTSRFGTVLLSLATYTPDPAMTDGAGLGIVGTATKLGKHL